MHVCIKFQRIRAQRSMSKEVAATAAQRVAVSRMNVTALDISTLRSVFLSSVLRGICPKTKTITACPARLCKLYQPIGSHGN